MDSNTSPDTTSTIRHLARLSDCIFAFAMALTVLCFDLPENIKSMTNAEINDFLFNQLKPLEVYLVTFTLVGFYWIDTSKQFAYYRKTNETHLWISVVYLMCLFLVPYSNDLLMSFSENVTVKILFSANIFLLGILSFASWVYATHKHRLVDETLDRKTITEIWIKSLIEPLSALLSIAVAFWNQSLWDWVWLLVPVAYIVVERFLNRLPNAIADNNQVLSTNRG